MSDEEKETGAAEQRVTAVADGWDVQLRFPASNKTSVKVRPLRVKDLRDMLALEKKAEADEASGESDDMVGDIVKVITKYTDATAEQAEDMSLTDLHEIREVIMRQAKKLMSG